MSKEWSKKVQSSEILFNSRVARFNGYNSDKWLEILGIKDGDKVLDVGCAGGAFCVAIKKCCPNCEVYGIDLDENHIEFAKLKAEEFGLDIKYAVADVAKLPFEDGTFDVVYSHTVVEHIPFDVFIKEQQRVLKTGGTVAISTVDSKGKVDQPFEYLDDEITALYKSLEHKNDKPPYVAKYYEQPNRTMQRLNEYGFKNIDFRYDRIFYYSPDTARIKEQAEFEIISDYECSKANAEFNINTAINGEQYGDKLLELIDKQYQKRMEMLNNGEKVFDYLSTVVATINAKK